VTSEGAGALTGWRDGFAQRQRTSLSAIKGYVKEGGIKEERRRGKEEETEKCGGKSNNQIRAGRKQL